MDPSTIAPLTLSADMGVAFYLAIGVIFAVNGVRWLMEVLPTTKTNNLPGWIWVIVAMVLACIICFFLHVDQIAKMFALTDIIIPAPWSYVATGIAIGMSSNILYLATQPLRKKYRDKTGHLVTLKAGEALPTGATAENEYCLDSQPGNGATQSGNNAPETSPVAPERDDTPPDTPSTPEPVEAITEAPSPPVPAHWPTARLLKEIHPPEGNTARYYISIDGEGLHEVE